MCVCVCVCVQTFITSCVSALVDKQKGGGMRKKHQREIQGENGEGAHLGAFWQPKFEVPSIHHPSSMCG